MTLTPLDLFFGPLYARYLALLQVSSAHVYLTVPFVLSWSMLEAMSAGCLVIGSDTAPLREVLVDGKNGLLVDFLSPTQIADRVDEVFAHSKRMQAMRKAARRTIVERYEVGQSLERYMKVVEVMTNRMIDERKRGAATFVPTDVRRKAVA